jgi:hypothetical protein
MALDGRVYDEHRPMPLFRRADPSLRDLIAYVVAQSRDRGITLNRTRLVKLLYLIDVERGRARGNPLTGVEWVFFHYGPYAFELVDTLDAMEGSELNAQSWKSNVLYRGAPGAPDGSEWPAGTKTVVDRVLERFAPLELNDLLDYVYFHTGPMKAARRGERLELERARDDAPQRWSRPLEPPPPPDDLEGRLTRWRSSSRRRLAPLTLDPPGHFLAGADEDEEPQAGGVLRVPEGTDL